MKNKLLQLLLDNRAFATSRSVDARSRITFGAKADDVAHIYLYDPIVSDKWMAEYFGGVCAQDLVPELHKITGDAIIHINCPGGEVFAMQAIMSAVDGMKGKVTAIVEGVCASAATGIASMCDEVIMEKGALYMVHNSQGYAIGDKNDLRQLADLMDKVDDGMVVAYVAKTGKDEKQVRAWMDAETWFKADEAVEAGFADKVKDSPKGKGAKAATEWKLTAYANAPAQEEPVQPPAPAPAPSPAPTPAPAPVAETISAEHRDRLQQRLRMRAVLGKQVTSATRAA